MKELDDNIKYFFDNGLRISKNALKQNLNLRFIIYDEDKNEKKEVDIDTYIYDRLYMLIENFFENRNIKLNEEEIKKITKKNLDIYYPNFLKELKIIT